MGILLNELTDGICNELAGTTGLAAPAALRSIDA